MRCTRFASRSWEPAAPLAPESTWHSISHLTRTGDYTVDRWPVWAKGPFVRRSQVARAVWRTELGRAVLNMRVSTATPTAASVRWPRQAASPRARADEDLVASHHGVNQRAPAVSAFFYQLRRPWA